MEFRGSIQCYGHGPRGEVSIGTLVLALYDHKNPQLNHFSPQALLILGFRFFFIHCSNVQGFLGKNLFPYSDLVLTNAHILEPILTVPSRSGIPRRA